MRERANELLGVVGLPRDATVVLHSTDRRDSETTSVLPSSEGTAGLTLPFAASARHFTSNLIVWASRSCCQFFPVQG